MVVWSANMFVTCSSELSLTNLNIRFSILISVWSELKSSRRVSLSRSQFVLSFSVAFRSLLKNIGRFSSLLAPCSGYPLEDIEQSLLFMRKRYQPFELCESSSAQFWFQMYSKSLWLTTHQDSFHELNSSGMILEKVSTTTTAALLTVSVDWLLFVFSSFTVSVFCSSLFIWIWLLFANDSVTF